MNKQNRISYDDDGIYNHHNNNDNNNNNNNTLISIFLLKKKKKKTKRGLKNFILTYLDIVCTKILDSSCLD